MSKPGSSRSRAWAGALLVFSMVGMFGMSPPAFAAPPEVSMVGIPPEREPAARDLLATVSEPDGLQLRGPSIEHDRIKWWLMRGEQARALLVLMPRSTGQPEDPRSKSFAIQIAWAPDVEPEPAERALLADATKAIQTRDAGGFYVVLLDTLLGHEDPTPSAPATPVAMDPERVKLLWSLKLGAVALLIGLAVGVTLRPDPSQA